MATSRNEFAPDSYWQAVKDRLSEIGQMPGNAIRSLQGAAAQGAVLNPNARQSTPEGAQSAAAMDPLQKQQLIQAIIERQGGQMPAQAVDQRQLILQEAQRRGIQVPPDSPLLQGQPQPPVDPNNPAGIQF